MFKPLVIATLVAVLAGACSVVGGQAAPEPAFTVVKDDAPFSVRRYPELVLVKTSMSDGSRAAFGRLFDYISGKNGGAREIAMTAPVLRQEQGTEIAMTAPVLQDQSGDGSEDMAFILTDDFTPETAPLPDDPAVRLDVVPDRRVAVVTFSGRADDALFAENLGKLQDWVAAEGLTPTGPPELAQYNPPWTLPNMRRNEVLIPVE